MKRLYLTFDQLFWIALLAVMVPIAGLRLLGLDADNGNYMNLLTMGNGIELLTKEFGFRALLLVNAVIFGSNPQSFFLIFAAFGITLKFAAFSKDSPLPELSLLLYFLSYFLLHDYTQIRAGVASGFFLLSMRDLAEGNKGIYFKKVVFACLFHWTALVMIPIYFIVRKFSLAFFAVLPLVGILVFLSGINFEQYILKAISGYPALALYYGAHAGHESSINIFNLINLGFFGIFVIIFAMLAWQRDEFSDFEVSLSKVFSLSLFGFYVFAIINKPVVAFRVFEFLNITLLILIPGVVLKFKQWYLAAVFFLGFFLVYFYHLLVNVRVIP